MINLYDFGFGISVQRITAPNEFDCDDWVVLNSEVIEND